MTLKNNIIIFVCKTNKATEDQLNSLHFNLPQNQQRQSSKIVSMKRKKEFIIGRSLLIKALKHYDSNMIPNIQEAAHKAPFIKNPQAPYLSISHSHDFICCTVHNFPVGIDIEYKKVRKSWSDAAQLFMNQDELMQLSKLISLEDKRHYFYKIWCMKEAIFKSLSYDEQSKVNFHSISSIYFTHKNSTWSLFETMIEDYQVSLAYTGGLCDVRPIFETFSKSINPLL